MHRPCLASNLTFSSNIVVGGAADNVVFTGGTPDSEAFSFFGDCANNHVIFTNNIFDFGTNAHWAMWNQSTGAGNQWTSNIIISNFAGNPANPYFVRL